MSNITYTLSSWFEINYDACQKTFWMVEWLINNMMKNDQGLGIEPGSFPSFKSIKMIILKILPQNNTFSTKQEEENATKIFVCKEDYCLLLNKLFYYSTYMNEMLNFYIQLKKSV